MQKIRWFFWILVITLVLVVALQNNDPTQFQLLLLDRTLPLSVLMLSATVIGFLFGSLMTASMLRSRTRAEKKPKKAVPKPLERPDPQPAAKPQKPAETGQEEDA